MPNEIDTYIDACPEEHRTKLRELRELILEAAPSLKQKFSWGMPTFHLKHNVIHFALHAHHIGIYPGAATMVAFQERLKPYKSSKGAFQLPLTQELPRDLLQDITRWSAEHNGP